MRIRVCTHLEKVDELLTVRPIGKEEVDALMNLLDVDALLVRIVLQDELLDEHEGALVVHMLSDLHRTRSPSTCRCRMSCLRQCK